MQVPGTNHPALFTKLIITLKPHWIHSEPPILANNQGVLECEFRFQRNRPLRPCKVFKTISDRLIIDLEEPQRAISPGQVSLICIDKYDKYIHTQSLIFNEFL